MQDDDITETGLTIPTPPPTEAPPALDALESWLMGARWRRAEMAYVREGAQFFVMLYDDTCAIAEGWGVTRAEAEADALSRVAR